MTPHEKVTIAIDFDGTIADHQYPGIGEPVPGAIESIRRLHQLGCHLILLTMRSGPTLEAAREFLRRHSIWFDEHNENKSQGHWTSSRKVYANFYVDDSAVGCPLRANPRPGGRDHVDWDRVMAILEQRLLERDDRKRREVVSEPGRA